jgi:hypothetical protein
MRMKTRGFSHSPDAKMEGDFDGVVKALRRTVSWN